MKAMVATLRKGLHRLHHILAPGILLILLLSGRCGVTHAAEDPLLNDVRETVWGQLNRRIGRWFAVRSMELNTDGTVTRMIGVVREESDSLYGRCLTEKIDGHGRSRFQRMEGIVRNDMTVVCSELSGRVAVDYSPSSTEFGRHLDGLLRSNLDFARSFRHRVWNWIDSPIAAVSDNKLGQKLIIFSPNDSIKSPHQTSGQHESEFRTLISSDQPSRPMIVQRILPNQTGNAVTCSFIQIHYQTESGGRTELSGMTMFGRSGQLTEAWDIREFLTEPLSEDWLPSPETVCIAVPRSNTTYRGQHPMETEQDNDEVPAELAGLVKEVPLDAFNQQRQETEKRLRALNSLFSPEDADRKVPDTEDFEPALTSTEKSASGILPALSGLIVVVICVLWLTIWASSRQHRI
ncbi:MAG: hypothetical protein R3C49_00435 [Planctomycetaceae bacterium]